MRNQKVTAPGVKGFDKRKSNTLKPKPSDAGKQALQKLFAANAKQKDK